MNDFSRIFQTPESQANGDIVNDSLAMALNTVQLNGGDAKDLNRAFDRAKDITSTTEMIAGSRDHYKTNFSYTVSFTGNTPENTVQKD